MWWCIDDSSKNWKKKPQNVLLFKVGQRQTDFTRVQHLNVETTAVNLSAAPRSLAVASRSQPIGGGLGRIPPQPQVGSGGGADGGASLCRSYWWRRSSGETVLSLPHPFLLLPGTLGSGTAYSPPTTTGRKEWVRHGQVAETFFGEKKPPPNHQSWRRGEGASTLVFTLSVLVEVVFFWLHLVNGGRWKFDLRWNDGVSFSFPPNSGITWRTSPLTHTPGQVSSAAVRFQFLLEQSSCRRRYWCGGGGEETQLNPRPFVSPPAGGPSLFLQFSCGWKSDLFS